MDNNILTIENDIITLDGFNEIKESILFKLHTKGITIIPVDNNQTAKNNNEYITNIDETKGTKKILYNYDLAEILHEFSVNDTEHYMFYNGAYYKL